LLLQQSPPNSPNSPPSSASPTPPSNVAIRWTDEVDMDLRQISNDLNSLEWLLSAER
jgi:hypothetical protein